MKNLISKLPSLSIRKAASAVGVFPTLVFSILHDDLLLKPYNFYQCQFLSSWKLTIMKKESISPIGSFRCQWTLSIFSYEATKHIFIYIGVNLPIWRDRNTFAWRESFSLKVSANRIFGLYLFEESVNQHNYLKMLKSFFSPKLQRTTNYRKYNFQQMATFLIRLIWF